MRAGRGDYDYAQIAIKITGAGSRLPWRYLLQSLSWLSYARGTGEIYLTSTTSDSRR